MSKRNPKDDVEAELRRARTLVTLVNAKKVLHDGRNAPRRLSARRNDVDDDTQQRRVKALLRRVEARQAVEWKRDRSYVKGMVVRHGGQWWLAESESMNAQPRVDSSTPWKRLHEAARTDER
jgi:hypothetical protein